VRPNDPLLDERVARRKFSEAEELYASRLRFQPLRWDVRSPRFSTLQVMRHRPDGTIAIGIELELRNYDFLPASVRYVDGRGRPLPWPELAPFVRAFPAPDGGPPRRWIVEAHASTGLPFLCRVGVLEFHTHLQHRHDRWEQYRGVVRLQTVVTDAFEAVTDGP
jgi:hypothetical protein